MSNVFELDRKQCAGIIQCAISQKIPTIMTYMSKNKWHVAKVVLVGQCGSALQMEPIQEMSRHRPLNVQIGQPVGISFKHSYAKFVFDTTIESLMPSSDPGLGGTLIVSMPVQIEAIQRRSYFRVNVPESLDVNVVFWHRTGRCQDPEDMHKYASGRLMDLSAGGAQLVITPKETGEEGVGNVPEFRKGQFIGLRFTPLPYEMPLVFNAQIRTVLPTADDSAVCLGLQLVGLEASQEGREMLSRIVQVVERYHMMNEGNSEEAPMTMSEEASIHRQIGSL